MSKEYFDHLYEHIEKMGDIERVKLAQKILAKVSDYDEPFEKMLKLMLLFYENIVEFESSQYDATFNEKVEAFLEEHFEIEVSTPSGIDKED